jgi:hypothetical protein
MRAIFCQTIDAVAKMLSHQESEMRGNTFGKVSYFQPAGRLASRLEPTRTENRAVYPADCGRDNFRDLFKRATLFSIDRILPSD